MLTFPINFSAKNGPSTVSTKSSGLSSSSSGDFDESVPGNSSPTSLSRRWASLDDLESDVSSVDVTHVFIETGSSQESCTQLNDKKSSEKSSGRSSTHGGAKHSPNSGKFL